MNIKNMFQEKYTSYYVAAVLGAFCSIILWLDFNDEHIERRWYSYISCDGGFTTGKAYESDLNRSGKIGWRTRKCDVWMERTSTEGEICFKEYLAIEDVPEESCHDH